MTVPKSEVRKLRSKLTEEPSEENSKRTAEYAWQAFGRRANFEGRQKWLGLAGWNPGWVLHNWQQLPEQLKAGLCWKLDAMFTVSPDKPRETWMSFICPKCGYADDLRWRNTYWDPFTSTMSWSDFKELYPEVAEELEWRRFTFRTPYFYERTVKFPPRYVRRGTPSIWKERGGTFSWYPEMDPSTKEKRHKITIDLLNPSTRNRPPKYHPRERITSWK